MCVAVAAAAAVVSTATTASKMTMQRLANDISSKADLPGKKVSTVLCCNPLLDTEISWRQPVMTIPLQLIQAPEKGPQAVSADNTPASNSALALQFWHAATAPFVCSFAAAAAAAGYFCLRS